MEYWYKQNGDKWEFWYKMDEEEQEIIDRIMPEAIKVFKGERVSETENDKWRKNEQ